MTLHYLSDDETHQILRVVVAAVLFKGIWGVTAPQLQVPYHEHNGGSGRPFPRPRYE